MNMRDAIAQLMPLLKDEFLICANGYISRDAFNTDDRPQSFYMLGSMGQASSIGLGLALARPEKKIVIFDGDGNLLMNLGILTMIARLKPKNLVHVVFDNECYDSTGGQPSISAKVNLADIAKGCGIPNVNKVELGENFAGIFKKYLTQGGPSFLLVKVERDPLVKVPRVNISPSDITERFKNV
ncbi:MAG: thiamine pyrophosphate-dependent enzyme [Candidatus Omnitrophota bacterium]